MRYLGGKAKVARRLVKSMADDGADFSMVWEPFCGGINVTKEIIRCGGNVKATDIHIALITMYQAVHSEQWTPPDAISEAEYHSAKTLPDTDPMKAFVGFGTTFGAKYFAGYGRDSTGKRNTCGEARRSLQWVRGNEHVTFEVRDFLNSNAAEHLAGITAIYCDPPYAGTTKYNKTPNFDHQNFYDKCQEYAAFVPVYVSEIDPPTVAYQVTAEYPRTMQLHAPDRSMTDYLYRILPKEAE